ncbi:hypothetical protein J6590_057171 [Homalodisca vitripennis]|nr:hypothetical protein J6590_057171 [Homalodisca vitripennis]
MTMICLKDDVFGNLLDSRHLHDKSKALPHVAEAQVTVGYRQVNQLQHFLRPSHKNRVRKAMGWRIKS